jgi:transketolase
MVTRTHDPLILSEIANQLREDVIRMLGVAGSGHLGGSLGLADIFSALYFSLLNHDPKNPRNQTRDRVVLSIGHVCPVLYATLARAGYFPTEELMTLRKLGSRLQGHPGREHGLPGLELSAGSLGQGLSVAVGMALAARIDQLKHRIIVVLGDGELQEGAVWEAAMSAAHYNLSSLIAVVDRNFVQIDGPVASVMEIEPLGDKWRSFGWNVFMCDGNDIPDFISAFQKAQGQSNKPSVIIAKTKMGKGVASIEGDYKWHGKAPSGDVVSQFLSELRSGQNETIFQ